MEINKKNPEEFNPYAGFKFAIFARRYSIQTDNPLEDVYQEGEEFEIESVSDFNMHVNRIRNENIALKELAKYSGKSEYTQKFISKL